MLLSASIYRDNNNDDGDIFQQQRYDTTRVPLYGSNGTIELIPLSFSFHDNEEKEDMGGGKKYRLQNM